MNCPYKSTCFLKDDWSCLDKQSRDFGACIHYYENLNRQRQENLDRNKKREHIQKSGSRYVR